MNVNKIKENNDKFYLESEKISLCNIFHRLNKIGKFGGYLVYIKRRDQEIYNFV